MGVKALSTCSDMQFVEIRHCREELVSKHSVK